MITSSVSLVRRRRPTLVLLGTSIPVCTIKCTLLITIHFYTEEEFSEEDDVDQSPASHHLAASLGMNAHRMQVMKASFFAEEEQVRLPSIRKDKATLEKSLLSGTVTETTHVYKSYQYSSVMSRGPLLSPKVHRTTETTILTSHTSQSLFGSPRIGNV